MNREILCRGKRLGSGEWIYGWYCVACFGKYPFEPCIIPADKAESGNLEHIRIDPSTVGQYTGLTDKNGKKIFEGDIVKTHYANTSKADFIEQVVFHNGKFCSLYRLSEHGTMWADLTDGVAHLPQDKTVYMEWCEVIGNIYDHPELLKKPTP